MQINLHDATHVSLNSVIKSSTLLWSRFPSANLTSSNPSIREPIACIQSHKSIDSYLQILRLLISGIKFMYSGLIILTGFLVSFGVGEGDSASGTKNQRNPVESPHCNLLREPETFWPKLK